MKHASLALATLAALSALAAAPARKAAAPAAAAAAPSVSVCGLRIVGPGYGEGGREAQAFNESSGVGLALVVQQSDAGAIIAFASDGSSLDEMTDSTGKNLLEDASIWPFP